MSFFKIARTPLLVTHHLSLVTCPFFIWRPHGGQNVRLIAKIFRGHFLDVFKRDRVHVMLESLIVIETKAVKLVERAMVTEGVVALIGDLLLSDQFLLRTL